MTWYSLRRRAATEYVLLVGPDAAREIMGHDPDTRTLERYYLKLADSYDVGAVAPDEEPNIGAAHIRDKPTPRHLKFLELDVIQGPALNGLVRKLL